MGGIFGGRKKEGGGMTPPSGQQPQAPATRRFSMTVQGTRGQVAVGFLVPDFHPPIEGNLVGPDRLEFVVPREIREGATIQVWAKGQPSTIVEGRARFAGSTVDELGGLPPGDYELDPLTIDWRRAIAVPGPWRVDGQFLREAATDRLAFELSTSAFTAFERYCRDGEGWLEDYCGYIREMGFNTIRMFLAYWGGLGQFTPVGVLERLPACWEVVGRSGLRVHQTVFADTPNWLPQPDAQQSLFLKVLGWAQTRPWVRLEGGNELDDARNRADGLLDPRLVQITQESGVLCSHGSTIQDGGYLTPVWRTADYHPARGGDDWPRRVGHNSWEDVASKVLVPTFASEIKRPDEDGYHEERFYQAGANAAQMCAGVTFHSQPGKAAAIYGAGDRACAQALIRGVADVPLEFRYGRYSAGHLSDSPVKWQAGWEGRAHAKILGGRALVVLSGMDPDISPLVQPQGGWGLVDRRGPFGEVLLLAK